MTPEKIQEFIAIRSASFSDREVFDLKTLKLSDIIGTSSLFWLHTKPTGSAADLIAKLVDSKLTLADESFARSTMEALALLVANRDAEAGNQIAGANVRAHSHQGAQSFWHLLSGEPELYSEILAQLGHQAKERKIKFSREIVHACNRITRELLDSYCTPAFAIDWKKLTAFAVVNAN